MAEDRFIVTARKYRPQTFSDLVSQLHVSETIRNAIVTGRLAHAYLFSGPRGVGKTTCARLLAKAINCTTSLANRERGEACRTCESCRNFEEGRSLNIIEIDAASNNSVEDIRALREKVIIPPQGAKKKVYIIDEVHMLSNAAFNALLKTLEEPPPHALFIFATTEPHKVLPTILSRCQRFDFKRISVQDVVTRLKEICQLEGFTADEESLVLIGQKGDGALRDALSVFDQSIALCGTDLHYEELAKALGVIAVDQYFHVTDLVKQQDSAAVFALVNKLMQTGADYQEFMVGLSEHLRNLLVALTTRSTEMIEASETVQQRYLETARQLTEADVLRLLHIVSEGEQALKTSPQPRLRLEMTLLKMVTMPRTVDLTTLLKKLDMLETTLKNGGGTPSGQLTVNSEQLAVNSKQVAVGSGQVAVASEQVVANPIAREQSSVQSVQKQSDVRVQQVAHQQTTNTTTNITTNTTSTFKPTTPNVQHLFGKPALQRNVPQAQAVDVAPVIVSPEAMSSSGAASSLVAEPSSNFVASVAPVAGKPTQPLTSDDLNRIYFQLTQQWSDFLGRIKQFRIAIHGMLQAAKPDHAGQGALHFAVPDVFHEQMLTQQRTVLAQQIATHLNLPQAPSIRFFVEEGIAAATEETKTANDPFQQLQRLSQTNPVIRTLLDSFGGEIVW